MNVEEGRMENYCRSHKENHSEITSQVFINLFGSLAKPSMQEEGQPTITKLEDDTEE